MRSIEFPYELDIDAPEIIAGIAVGTALRSKARAAPRTDPSERDYRTRLLPRVRASKRSQG